MAKEPKRVPGGDDLVSGRIVYYDSLKLQNPPDEIPLDSLQIISKTAEFQKDLFQMHPSRKDEVDVKLI